MQIKFPVQENPEIFSLLVLLWKRRERIAWGLAILLLGTVFFTYNMKGREKSANDYLVAKAYQNKLESHKEIDEKGLSKLLKKHPELLPLFAHHLEDRALLSGNLAEAKKLTEASWQRLSFLDPLYYEYATASLLIEEGRYEEALKKAAQIAEVAKKETFPKLYTMNKVRIAFLESQLGKKSDGSIGALPDEVVTHLRDQKLSFLDFLKR